MRRRAGRAKHTPLPPHRTALLPPTPRAQARAEQPLAPGAYHLATFLAYSFYPPLYIAGPILTFNQFGSQLASPSPAAGARAAARYWLRGAACWGVLEACTHCLWFYSVSKHRLWEALAAARGAPLSPFEMVLAPWWMVILVWLKFLVIWRFFRCARAGVAVGASVGVG